ncbi:hypothetical protein RHSIM_Rhsim03G0136200 [Rhododendron simsii]|uniref:Uncharacterized protein n=1 Tax=Rhododendron simsii TaxID=118357 RepID=A0A834HB62_RHOSS|nr:hypothetical protein RHSIM_Rhsim03G0136200 [Rhododendron simsii]
MRFRSGVGIGETGCDSERVPYCFQALSVLGVHLSEDQIRDLVALCSQNLRFVMQFFQMGSMKAPGPDGFVASKLLPEELRLGQVLSANLSHFASSAVCKGVAVSSHPPPISHLFFANDSFFFLNFDPAEVMGEYAGKGGRSFVNHEEGWVEVEGFRIEWGVRLSKWCLRGSLMGAGGLLQLAREMVVDGAWKKDSWEEAMAWCSVGDSGGVRNGGVMKVFASSALMVEALAVLHALVWAYERQWSLVEIYVMHMVLSCHPPEYVEQNIRFEKLERQSTYSVGRAGGAAASVSGYAHGEEALAKLREGRVRRR